MKLMNICAAIVLSGLFTMAASAMMLAGKVCQDEHKQCMAAGKSHEHCQAEEEKCYADLMHGKR